MHGLGHGLAVELAHLFNSGLECVDAGVALDAVVVADVLVLAVEVGLELQHLGVGRVHRQAHVGHGAVGGVTGQFDHLLAGQRGLADDGLVPALLAQFAQGAGRLFFVGVDKHRVGAAVLGAQHSGRPVHLAGFGGDFSGDLGGAAVQRLLDRVQAAFAEVVVHVHDRQVLGLGDDVLRHLRHRRFLGEAGAEHERVALLGDGGGLTTGPVGHLGAAAFGHADHDGAREHRAEDGKHLVVHCFLRQALGHAGVGLGVVAHRLDLLAQDAASGVDFLDRQLHAVLEVGARCGATARQLHDIGDLDAALGSGGTTEGQGGAGGQQLEGESLLHDMSPECCKLKVPAGILRAKPGAAPRGLPHHPKARVQHQRRQWNRILLAVPRASCMESL